MMQANKVDHILRAAGQVTGRQEFVLIGSAAIFAWRRTVPREMAMTREVDLFAYDRDPDEVDRISTELDSILGQASQFDAEFGYYCDGVGPETAILPIDWETRAKRYASPATNGVMARVPEPHDIAVAKLCAGREKDLAWLAAAARYRIIDLDRLPPLFHLLPPPWNTEDERLSAKLEIVRTRSRNW